MRSGSELLIFTFLCEKSMGQLIVMEMLVHVHVLVNAQ